MSELYANVGEKVSICRALSDDYIGQVEKNSRTATYRKIKFSIVAY